MNDQRLQQLIDYARALAVMAKHGRGNVKDTADILRALYELRAWREFNPNGKAIDKKRAA